MFRTSLACLVVLLLGAARPAAGSEPLFDEQAHDFGTVPRGVMLSHPFRLTNTGDRPVRVTGIRVSCGCTTGSMQQAEVPAGQSGTLLAQMDTRRFAGTKTVTIFVTFDRGGGSEEAQLSVTALSREDFTVSPDAVAFGKVLRGAEPAAGVTVAQVGDPGWQITGVSSDSNYVQVSAKASRQPTGEITYALTARLRPDTPVGRWFTDVWLHTDRQDVGRIRIPVSVEVDPPLALNPRVVDMGQVPVGEEAERRVEVRGARPFRITEVRGVEGPWRVEGGGPDAKDVHTLMVRLRAEKAGDLKRSFQVITSLAENNVVEVPVHAVGAPH
jgi:hypothetical protein